MDKGIQKVCASIGTAICPGVGTAVGYVAGVGISYLSANLKFGKPPKSINDHVKDFAKDVRHKVSNCLSKLFW